MTSQLSYPTPFVVSPTIYGLRILANNHATRHQGLAFRTGDTVCLLTGGGASREGPYLVNEVLHSTKRYTLVLENGQSVKDGAEFEEKDLVAA